MFRLFTITTMALLISVASPAVLRLSSPAHAGIGASGSTGILDLDTPEMLPPGWMSVSTSARLDNVEIGDRRLHTFRMTPSLTVGLNGGLELSTAVPVQGFFRTGSDESGVSSLFNEDFSVRFSDPEIKLKQAFPVGGEALRFGLQGLATMPLGSDRFEGIYAGADSIQPYTSGEWNLGLRGLLTLDLTGPGGVPLRMHLNGGYVWNRNESRYSYYRAHPYALPAVRQPHSDSDNDVMLLGAALEFPAFRQAAFVELTTEQFVNDRSLLEARENPIQLTPGARFNLPGGIGLTTAVSFNLSGDSDKTAFEPGDVYPDWQARAVISFGDIFQSRKARLERREQLKATGVTPPSHAPSYVDATDTNSNSGSSPTSTGSSGESDQRDREQKDAAKSVDGKPMTEGSSTATGSAAEASSTGESAGLESNSVMDSTASMLGAPRYMSLPNDMDGDGILDADDRCPRHAEDRDGFRDFDGCPDLDNDMDGILDLDDLCPNSQEDHLGPYPFDGCPSTVRTAPNARDQGSIPEPGALGSGSAMFRPLPTWPEESPSNNPTSRSEASRSSRDSKSVNSSKAAASDQEVTARIDELTGALRENRRTENQRLDDLNRTVRDLSQRLEAMQLRAIAGSSSGSGRVYTDSDGDGVADAFDRCPERKEDMDGWEDADGCPDTDNDGDGIPDSDDRCPNVAETWNGYEDRDGCPDEAPGQTGSLLPGAESNPSTDEDPAASAGSSPGPKSMDSLNSSTTVSAEDSVQFGQMLQRREFLLHRLHFPSGGAALTSSHREILRGIAELSGVVEVVCEGHSDGRGSSSGNLELSRKRATAARDYLIELGMPPSVVSITARGESDPLADDSTEFGRTENRRVDVLVRR